MTITTYIPSVLSSLFRLAAYVFLQIIPTSLANPALPVLYVLYLVSLWIFPPEEDEFIEKEANEKTEKPLPPRPTDNVPLTLALSLPTSSKWVRCANFAINGLLLLACADLALSPFYDAAEDVVFTRVGAVSPSSAKITVRYPQGNVTQDTLRVLYREAGTDTWKDGPQLDVKQALDWVDTVSLTGLYPQTRYEYALATANRTLLPYPAHPVAFRTFPDPRLGLGSKFRFLVSSCITPNFPYKGPFHRRSIHGFDLLDKYLHHRKENDTASIPPEFLLFLGDFIYADVPVYIGDDKDAYRRLYRRNYNSPSFRKIYEQLPILHAYDDHEFKNNYAGEGYDVPPFANASDAFSIYNAAANHGNQNESNYHSFQYGDTAFFVLDTRRYRSPVKSTDPSERSMLGDVQLAALNKWLSHVNDTATFKFVVSSVPFTSLWTHDAQVDAWPAYPKEKAALLEAFHTVPNLVILSGDRHEFALIEFNSPDPSHHVVREISTSPLSMFYIPIYHTLKPKSEETFVAADGETQVAYERATAYIPTGNAKWSSIEIDTTNHSRPILNLETVIDGEPAYHLEVIGTPTSKSSGFKGLGAAVSTNIRDLFDKFGFASGRWF